MGQNERLGLMSLLMYLMNRCNINQLNCLSTSEMTRPVMNRCQMFDHTYY